MITRQMESPIPKPLSFVETNGSNNVARMSAGTPGPVSATLISVMWFEVNLVESVSTRRRPLAIASVALRTRLKTTCSICTRSKKASDALGSQRISTAGACSPAASKASRAASRSNFGMFSRCFSDLCRATNSRICSMISVARAVCSTKRSSAIFNWSVFDASNNRRLAAA